MDLALIPPNAMLEDTRRCGMQMLLPQEILTNGPYRQYYYDQWLLRLPPKHSYIMDNGAAEATTVPMHQLLDLVHCWAVDEFVIPDVLADPGKTYDHLNSFFSWNFGTLGINSIGVKKNSITKLGFVAQGHNFDEALRLVKRVMYSSWSRYISVIYLPFLLLRVSGNREERIKLAMRVHEEFPDMPIHFLGGSTTWPREMIAAKELGFVRSMDTSLPYKLGHYKLYVGGNDWGTDTELSRPENYFQREWTDPEKGQSKENVEAMLSWL